VDSRGNDLCDRLRGGFRYIAFMHHIRDCWNFRIFLWANASASVLSDRNFGRVAGVRTPGIDNTVFRDVLPQEVDRVTSGTSRLERRSVSKTKTPSAGLGIRARCTADSTSQSSTTGQGSCQQQPYNGPPETPSGHLNFQIFNPSLPLASSTARVKQWLQVESKSLYPAPQAPSSSMGLRLRIGSTASSARKLGE
jgi:hypothetical protein